MAYIINKHYIHIGLKNLRAGFSRKIKKFLDYCVLNLEKLFVVLSLKELIYAQWLGLRNIEVILK